MLIQLLVHSHYYMGFVFVLVFVFCFLVLESTVQLLQGHLFSSQLFVFLEFLFL